MQPEWSVKLEDVFRLLAPGVVTALAINQVVGVPKEMQIALALVCGPILYAWLRSTCVGGVVVEKPSPIRKLIVGKYDSHVIESASTYSDNIRAKRESNTLTPDEVMNALNDYLEDGRFTQLPYYADRKRDSDQAWCLLACAIACTIGLILRVVADALSYLDDPSPCRLIPFLPGVIGWWMLCWLLRGGASLSLKVIRRKDAHAIMHSGLKSASRPERTS